jgi:hypothetical protein
MANPISENSPNRKHAFAASKFAVVRLEELDSLQKLRADAIAFYQPVNSQELFAVERIALAQQSLLRCATLESGLFTLAMSETVAPDGLPLDLLSEHLTADIQVTRSQNRSLCAATGFERILLRSDAFKFFLRYQAQTERLYRRAVEEFDRLKALRSTLPAELPAESLVDSASGAETGELPQPDDLYPPTDTTNLPPLTHYDPTIARHSPLPPLSLPPKNGKRRRH